MNTILFCLALLTPSPAPVDGKAAFEQMKTMAGEWQGVANDGRKIKHSLELIAGESVLMERSWFDAHPGQMMVTMYHVDGNELILTHYCVAKNQPRLQATEVSADGKSILFTFKDATNLKNRDAGHMDKASYVFLGKDRFKSKWTWYQQGKEQWMEEFTFERVKEAGKAEISAAGGSCCGGN